MSTSPLVAARACWEPKLTRAPSATTTPPLTNALLRKDRRVDSLFMCRLPQIRPNDGHDFVHGSLRLGGSRHRLLVEQIPDDGRVPRLGAGDGRGGGEEGLGL